MLPSLFSFFLQTKQQQQQQQHQQQQQQQQRTQTRWMGHREGAMIGHAFW